MSMKNSSPGSSIHGQYEGGNEEICIANISPTERLKRLIIGIIPCVISIALLVWLIGINADRLWRLPLFLLFMLAGAGFFQWSDKTCVGLSSRGSRNIHGHIEKIEDEQELAQVHQQARNVWNKALLVAVILTLIAQVV